MLGEYMNSEDEQLKCENIKKSVKTAIEKEDRSFLNTVKDKSDLKFMQKCFEIEISEENTNNGIQLTLIALGLSIFLYGLSQFLYGYENQILQDFLSCYWIFSGIIIFFCGGFWGYLRQFNTKKQQRKIDFIYDMILQIERMLKKSKN